MHHSEYGDEISNCPTPSCSEHEPSICPAGPHCVHAAGAPHLPLSHLVAILVITSLGGMAVVA
jgi:hypothetical protein